MAKNKPGYSEENSRTFGKMPKLLMHDQSISAGAKLLYGNMHWRAGRKREHFEGQQSMADHLGVSRQTIKRWSDELVRAHWIAVTRRRKNKDGQYLTNLYYVFDHPDDYLRWLETHGKSA